MKPAVLLGFVRGIEAMANALLERADLDIITLYDPSSELLHRRGIEHRNLSDFATDSLRERALDRAENRCRLISGQFSGEQMASEWPHFLPRVWAGLSAEVNRLMCRDFVEQILLVDLLRRCSCEMDLRLIVVHEDICRDTKTAIMAAHRLGVPALHILHGFPGGTTNAHDTVTADVIAAYSERAKGIYVGFGAPPERVVVTGNPFWDVYARPPLPAFKEQACESLGLDPRQPIIHCALTNKHSFSTAGALHPEYHIKTAELVLRAFAALAERYPSWQFLIRPHPSDHSPVEHLLRRAAEAGIESIQVDRTYAYDSIVISDVLVCTESNMGIEAILQGKPVVNVEIPELLGTTMSQGMGPIFLEDDAVLRARRPEEIAPQIEAAVIDEPTKQHLLALRPRSIARFNHANDGRAMERVCALIMKMVQDPSSYATPVARYPQFEPALAEAVPLGAESALVVGRAAPYVADRITDLRPGAAITTLEEFREGNEETEPAAATNGTVSADAVVLADPLPHSGDAEKVLNAAKKYLRPGAALIVPFEHGVTKDSLDAYADQRWIPPRKGADAPRNLDAYCWAGVEIVLSRCDLEPTAALAVEGLQLPSAPNSADSETLIEATAGPYEGDREVEGWVVVMRPRPQRLGEYGQARKERIAKAERANRRGESRFAQGDILGAVKEFAAAVNECNEIALHFSNLAAAFHAAGDSQRAWDHLVDAMHLDPSHEATRENLRTVAAALDREEEAERILTLFGSTTTE